MRTWEAPAGAALAKRSGLALEEGKSVMAGLDPAISGREGAGWRLFWKEMVGSSPTMTAYSGRLLAQPRLRLGEGIGDPRQQRLEVA
ncbi:hypothetical protein OCUBac02_12870 [Bosea sp. ANAM02]|nr:hypothetical protein OCUBac02_12870 [Bosea sp. ANAM02]